MVWKFHHRNVIRFQKDILLVSSELSDRGVVYAVKLDASLECIAVYASSFVFIKVVGAKYHTQSIKYFP